jgi:uncharacterized protein involved in cysteine biosynthesis
MSTFVAQGLCYFLTHPRLWLLTLCPLLLSLVVAVASVVVLFATALLPQADGLEDAGVAPWLAWILAVMLVIVEIFLVTIIYRLVIEGCYQDKIFEWVLINEGFRELVENENRHASCLRSCRAECNVGVWCQLLLLIVTLPLNLIPIVGSVLYAWLNGTLMAWGYHMYYFEMKNFSYGQQKAFVHQHKFQYSTFGMQAVLMELIPGVGYLFIFTNAVGAALMAASFEREEARDRQLQAPQQQQHPQSAAFASMQDPNSKAQPAPQTAYVPPYGTIV